jgi:hypothetical protein
MSTLLTRLMRTLAEVALADRVISAVSRVPAQIALAFAAAVLGLAAAGCGCAALWIAAVPYLGRAGAPLMVAFLLAIGALLCILRMRRPLMARRVTIAQTSTGAAGPPDLAPILAAAVAGFLGGLSGGSGPHG